MKWFGRFRVTIVGASLLVVGAASTVVATRAVAVTPEQTCQQQKLKALGKRELCLRRNAAKLLAGGADGAARCQAKFSATLMKAGSCRYLDNGDGTVSDLNNGLIWEQKDAVCPGAHCYTDTFTWTANPEFTPDGTAFSIFLYGLNGGTSPDGAATSGCFAGHCDWRLPTVEELTAIVDPTQGFCSGPSGSGPCIDPVFGPTPALFYWSTTTDADIPYQAYGVFFGIGGPVAVIKAGIGYVRAVRGGS
jgi:hypothetical protein